MIIFASWGAAGS